MAIKKAAKTVWTKWDGGDCPVSPETMVLANLRIHKSNGIASPAGQLRWSHLGSGGDIVSYSVVKEAPAPAPYDPQANKKKVVKVDVIKQAQAERQNGSISETNALSSDELHKALTGPVFHENRELPAGQTDPAYDKLRAVLDRAFDQASGGKGKERHANGLPFEEQPMASINRQLGSIDGFIYQAHKKSLEAKRLPDGRAQAELLGAINYLAGAVIALDTWAKKETK